MATKARTYGGNFIYPNISSNNMGIQSSGGKFASSYGANASLGTNAGTTGNTKIVSNETGNRLNKNYGKNNTKVYKGIKQIGAFNNYVSSKQKAATEKAETESEANLQNLADEYQNTFDESKAINEARYGEIKADYDTMLSNQMKNLEGSGEQERQDIENTWAGKESQGMQDLISSGMYTSTIKPTMSMGYTSAKNADLRSLNQRLLDAKTKIYGDVSQNKLNFMERREDTYPDYNQLLTLAQMQGQVNAGTTSSSTSGGSNTPITSTGTTGGKTIKVKTKENPNSKTILGSAQKRQKSLTKSRFV